jgi:UDPglucose 6-dehydrogenase
MNILVIGTGYVGLVTATCFAEMGHQVIGYDINKEKINLLQSGKPTIFEPGLDELITRNLQDKRLSFTTNLEEALKETLVCFIAVDTPMGDDGTADLSKVESVAKDLGQFMTSYKVVVNKSTVPVGTANFVKQVISKKLKERKASIEFDVASNPEFLKEGDALNDFMRPDRVILGVDNVRVGALLKELYSPFTLNHERIFTMDIASAEMSKYAANAMLATRISFMNELSGLCDKVGADITKVRQGIGSDQRIGYSFLYAGCGYGGSCFPKDLKALKATAQHYGSPLKIVEAVDLVNQEQKNVIGKKINEYFGTNGNGKTIAILGLAFKPNTDDTREAPAIILAKQLLKQGFCVRLFDPIAMDNTRQDLPDSDSVYYAEDELDATNEADAIALMTEWKQFHFMDMSKVLEKMQGNAFFDGRNLYSPEEMKEKGFDYFSIGRPTPRQESALCS